MQKTTAVLLTCLISMVVACPLGARAQSQTDRGATAAEAPIEDSLNVWERRLVQEGLILLGYYNGFADGQFAKGTRNAITDYQTQHNRAATGRLTTIDAVELGGAALALRDKLGWQPLADARAGLTMSYPAALLTKRQANQSGGETLTSTDGRLALKTLRFTDVAADGIDTLFRSMTTRSNEQITYQFRRPGLFILSGNAGENKFYSRFEQRGSEIRGYDLTWLAQDGGKIFENISVLISNGFYPFGDNSTQGQPSYPTLIQLARQNKSSGETTTTANADPAPARDSSGNNSSDHGKDGLVEQAPDALPAPKDGSLTTSDGRGLRFFYQYMPPDNPDLQYAYKWATDTHLFSNIPEIDGLDGLFVLPRPLRYVTAQCGAVNAFYNSKLSAVILCYEMIDSLRQIGEALSKGASDPQALTVEFVRDNLRFILLHESGHAMIDLMELAAVGREEDSVDQLAAVWLLSHVETNETQNDIARVLQLAATWFKVNSASSEKLDASVFADEHSLDAQRYFNLLCMVYGLSPDANQGIVDKGMLPKERAARCPQEATKINRSWARLMLPHFAPRFQPGAKRDGSSPAPASQATMEKNALEWDGKSNPFGK